MAGGDRRNADAILIAALAGGATVQDAAKRAHVAERTVYRRLSEQQFREQVMEARAEMVSQAVGALAEASTTAVRTLSELMGETVAPTVRLGAARTILELGSKLGEAEELEQRIAALEEPLAAHPRGLVA